MLKPHPAQQKKEQLRMQAHASGLRFTMRSLPKLATDMEAPLLSSVYYLPPKTLPENVRDWMLRRTAYAHEGNFYQDWDWQGDGRANHTAQTILKVYLPQAPAGLKAITAGNDGVSIYWDEKNGEELLPDLVKLMEAVAQSESLA
jgi:hypothetical protein